MSKLGTAYNYSPLVGFMMETGSSGVISIATSSPSFDNTHRFTSLSSLTTVTSFGSTSSVVTSETFYSAGLTATDMTNSLT